MKTHLLLATGTGLLLAFLNPTWIRAQEAGETSPEFYSRDGREYQVRFDASYRSKFTDLDSVARMTKAQKDQWVQSVLHPTFQYLFGPLVERQLGSPLKTVSLDVDWAKAELDAGRVLLPYSYSGTWIVRPKGITSTGLVMPVPFNADDLFTPGWKSCTDSDPEHQTRSFYWYFWDPERRGCDHKEGREYQEVQVKLGQQTMNTPRTYPEYARMIRTSGATKTYAMTFAFGYVKDPLRPNPERDSDAGMLQYRDFVQDVRKALGQTGPSPEETAILQSEYPGSSGSQLQIGHRFIKEISGVKVTVNVVASAGVDQMILFAKSFAHDHDALFGWLGHSRVGAGFDADRFGQLMRSNPGYYSVTREYQVIYWGGCNSYSYYTLPFFEFKARAGGSSDPKGTKNLDIIANGLPSLFALNSANAFTVFRNFLNWQARPSYQTILNELESHASSYGTTVLSAVLGDEDNSR